MDDMVTEKERALALRCMECPLCKRARRKQRGIAFWFVKHLEGGICPACKAYEKVYGRKAHEPIGKQGEYNKNDKAASIKQE